MMPEAPLIVITGPTASGKTARAVDVARAVDGEIVSADSRQIFRGMDLGTGKDIGEYGTVPYHLIDIRPAGCMDYNLFQYLRDADAAIRDIRPGAVCRCCVAARVCMWRRCSTTCVCPKCLPTLNCVAPWKVNHWRNSPKSWPG